jgi:hypothetical protein
MTRAVGAGTRQRRGARLRGAIGRRLAAITATNQALLQGVFHAVARFTISRGFSVIAAARDGRLARDQQRIRRDRGDARSAEDSP